MTTATPSTPSTNEEVKAALIAQLETPHLTEQEVKRIHQKLEVLKEHS